MSGLPKRLVVIVGTYDGVLAGWDTASPPPPSAAIAPADIVKDGKNKSKTTTREERDDEDIESRLTRKMNDGKYLRMTFATAAHEGSVRCLDVSSSASAIASASSSASAASSSSPHYGPGMLLSGGYDESINVYDLHKKSQNGELRTPADMGSPCCCSFAPPSNRVVSSAGNDDDDDGDDAPSTHATSTSDAPPTSTHAIIGTSTGKIVIYKRNDWSVQHVLSGHGTGGVHCLAVHPTGRMALSGGVNDGKLILWDLVKGRLAYVHKIKSTGKRRSGGGGKDNDGGRMESINHIAWCGDGSRYAYCHGSRIVARDATTGEDLLDVDMSPNCARVNMVTFIGGDEGMFLAAACDDGGLPVLEVGQLFDDDDDDDDDDGGRVKKPSTRRAVMAIEPVDGVVAGDERFKCIRSIEGGSGFLVVTANSGGVVSIMDLEGAVRMMLTPDRYNEDDDDDDDDDGDGRKSSSTRKRGKDDDDDDQSTDSSSSSFNDDDEEVEAAVEILDSVRVGSGARITDLAVWSYGGRRNDGVIDPDDDDASSREEDGDDASDDDDDDDNEGEDEDEEGGGSVVAIVAKTSVEERGVGKRKMHHPSTTTRGNRGGYNNGRDDDRMELDPEAVERARKLVGQAKEHEKRKKRKLAKKS